MPGQEKWSRRDEYELTCYMPVDNEWRESPGRIKLLRNPARFIYFLPAAKGQCGNGPIGFENMEKER